MKRKSENVFGQIKTTANAQTDGTQEGRWWGQLELGSSWESSRASEASTETKEKRASTKLSGISWSRFKGHTLHGSITYYSGKGYTPVLDSTAVTGWQAWRGDKSWLVDRVLKRSWEGARLKLLHTCWILGD